jgi:hypothetical protein
MAWFCSFCMHRESKEQEVRCWKCGIGEMNYFEPPPGSGDFPPYKPGDSYRVTSLTIYGHGTVNGEIIIFKCGPVATLGNKPLHEVLNIPEADLELSIHCGQNEIKTGMMVLMGEFQEAFDLPATLPRAALFTAFVRRITHDPDPGPPGRWRGDVSGFFPMNWTQIHRRTCWERLAADD